MATIDTITNILQENLDIDPSTVTAESTFDSLGIDSLDTVGDLVAYVDSL